MRKTINNILHTAGALVFVYGLLLGVRAAGLADLGGDFSEMTHICAAGVAAMACGAFIGWWKV